MSHLTLRMGGLLHLPWFARHLGYAVKSPTRSTTASTVPEARSSDVEDLAFFGLCKETRTADPRAELEHLALLNLGPETLEGLDETILYLL
jgi:hypothetical protein